MIKISRFDNAGKISTVLGRLFSFTLLAVVAISFFYRQDLIDYYRLHGYVAPASIVQLSTETTMTPLAQRVFYVNHPQLKDKVAFANSCPNRGGEKTIILGCYHGNQNGVYLLQVVDKRLNGVIQVTAAHETLHAFYDRLSSSERSHVDAMLLDYYHNGLKDQRIKDTIDGYRQSEPKDLVNEMHSIFGTEVATLPHDLETYYQHYFKDRSKVIAYAEQYQGEFSSRQAAIKQDDQQLSDLKHKFNALEASLAQEQTQITARQQDLIAKQRSGDIAGYNAGVAPYNASIDSYNSQVRLVQSLVSQYNQLVNSRNELASEVSELSAALSTNAAQLNR